MPTPDSAPESPESEVKDPESESSEAPSLDKLPKSGAVQSELAVQGQRRASDLVESEKVATTSKEKPADHVRKRLVDQLTAVVIAIVVLVMVNIYADKAFLYFSVIHLVSPTPNAADDGAGAVISGEKFAEMQREHTQQANALMTLLITTGFSALSGAIGFYFGGNRRPED